MQLTEEQVLIQDMARSFAQEQIKPCASEWDAKGIFPAQALQQMGGLGFMGMLVPEQWGGSETGNLAYVLALEEVAAADGATSAIMSVHNSVGCVPILKFGTDEQKQRFLTPLAQGRMIGAFALTEPHTGSDAPTITKTATAMNIGPRSNSTPLRNGTASMYCNGSGDSRVIQKAADAAIMTWRMSLARPGSPLLLRWTTLR